MTRPYSFEYAVDLIPDDNDILLVTSSDFPELTTFGEDRKDALEKAVGALVAVISARIDDREEIPRPAPAKGRPTVALPTLIASKVALYRAMSEAGLTQAALAERLGCDPRQVRRLLDPLNASRQDHIDNALRVLGKRLVVSVSDAV